MTTATPATIRLDGLSVYAHHGMVEEERTLGQRFDFDIELELTDCTACRTDDAQDAVAYEAIADVVVEVATSFRFRLMEALAEAVCMELLAEFAAETVQVRVAKPSPAISHVLRSASVVVCRSRGSVNPVTG